jgi:hypothetical protein
MKASDIITDDIVSREKHKTRDVVGKKTTSQDYFGNRADKQKDRDLVSKDKRKESKKEWFEEGEDPCWKDYKQVGMKKKNGRKVPNCVPREGIEESFRWTEFFPLLEMSERMELLENYFTSNRNLLESNDKLLAKRFLNLRQYSAKPVVDQKFVVTLISLINDKFRMIESPEVFTFVEENGNEYIVRDSTNNLKKFPSDYVNEVVIAETLFFDTTESYNNFRSMIGITFNAHMPDTDVDSLLNGSVDEGWKQNLAGAALAGAAALGGAGAHAAPQVPQAPQATSVASSNAAIVKSLVNPQAQKRFAAQASGDSTEQHSQWLQNVKNAAEFDNPYQIIRTAINMAGVTPKEVLQNLPKGYKLPTTEPTGTYVPRGTPRTTGVDEGSMQAAAHKKSGPKFGGYYGATQKGAPRSGQGFGGAAESTGSKISIKGKK